MVRNIFDNDIAKVSIFFKIHKKRHCLSAMSLFGLLTKKDIAFRRCLCSLPLTKKDIAFRRCLCSRPLTKKDIAFRRCLCSRPLTKKDIAFRRCLCSVFSQRKTLPFGDVSFWGARTDSNRHYEFLRLLNNTYIALYISKMRRFANFYVLKKIHKSLKMFHQCSINLKTFLYLCTR